MRESIPIPGTSKSKLIQTGIRLFSEFGYEQVEVDRVAAEAGVTIGSLYHHFKSKKVFFGVIRDDLTKRIIDRMEAAAEALPEQALQAALLAAYDGVLRIKAGKILTAAPPSDEPDHIVQYLSSIALNQGYEEASALGVILGAALKAALEQDKMEGVHERHGRKVLEKITNRLA
ncbi:TetR/AcrR family transcriptional regulator [Paenibacillaceae bacterium]|nr:TetR/AcrR family transcriptional regulator [Paenibacillaceae bacterium]